VASVLGPSVISRGASSLGDPVAAVNDSCVIDSKSRARRSARPATTSWDEGDERAHRDVAVARRVGAEAEHDDQRQVRMISSSVQNFADTVTRRTCVSRGG